MPTVENDEIALRQVIGIVKKVFSYLFAQKLLIIIVSLLGGAIGLIYAIKKEPVYKGKLTFVLSNDSKGGGGGLASLVGQLGIDASSGGGAFEGDNIMELLKSRTIIKGALFKPVGPSNVLLANVIGEKVGFFEGWKKNPRTQSLVPFPVKEKLVGVQDSLINIMHGFILQKYLQVEKPEKKLSFYTVATTAPEELVSVFLTKNLVEEAARMYIDTKTKTARENLTMMQHEADSLRRKLGGSLYSTANAYDKTFNLNPAAQLNRTPAQQGQVEVQVLGTAYGEVLKNVELAKINLQKETPLYQIIDEPSAPLVMIKVRKSVAIVVGGILGLLIASGFVLIRKFYLLFIKSGGKA